MPRLVILLTRKWSIGSASGEGVKDTCNRNIGYLDKKVQDMPLTKVNLKKKVGFNRRLGELLSHN